MKINYFFKTFKLILLILNVIYFMGVFWFIYCEIGLYFMENVDDDNFLSQYKLLPQDGVSNFSVVITIMYYSFTTLSTVGFGDIRPTNNHERLVCAFIMFFGVAIFSLVMSLFLEIIQQYKRSDEDIGDQEALISFFLLLHQKNKNKQINTKMQEQLEEYFEYRWNNDKNSAIKDEVDL